MEGELQFSPAELQTTLLAVCSSHDWSPAFLNNRANSSQHLIQLCIKELAACRAAGRGKLAVTLADAASSAGLAHPRLASHRERARGQQQGGALVRRDQGGSSALATATNKQKRGGTFWSWLPGFGGKRSRSTPAMSGSSDQIEALCATCRDAGWTPRGLGGEPAYRDLTRALLREMRACSEAGEHRLVVRLGRQAAKLGIQHPRIKRARCQAQALLNSTLHSQLDIAIQLREQGQAAASLALLDSALNAGHRSPWIEDNRARALVDLGRRQEAFTLWEKLQSHDDPAVADAAQQMLQLELHQLLLRLHSTLQHLAGEHAWPVRHLADPAGLDLQAYTISLLQEAIEARDNEHPELSLAMVDAALSAGLTNPWLLDNRARALVHLNQLPEAVAIWQELSHQEDDALRSSSQEMVDLFGAKARRQKGLAEADHLLEAGDREQAIRVLTDALLDDPDCMEVQSMLQNLLADRDSSLASDLDDSAQELEPHRRGLLVFTEVLNTLEQRLQICQDNA